MTKLATALLLCLSPLAVACNSSPPEPGPTTQRPAVVTTQPGTPVLNAAAPNQKLAAPALRPARFSQGDLAADVVRLPGHLVKGVYGRGTVHKWAEVSAADRKNVVEAHLSQPATSKVYFSKEPVVAGDHREFQLPIDAATGAEIFVVPGATPEKLRATPMSQLAVEMRSPGGDTVRAEDAKVHVTDHELAIHDAVPLLGAKFQRIGLDAPTPGIHTISYKPTSDVLHVGAVVVQNAGVELSFSADRPAVLVGDAVVLTARVQPGVGQTAGLSSYHAKVVSQTGRAAGEVDFTDDGIAPDAAANDGVYSARFVPTSDDMEEMGAWSVLVEASGTTGEGAPFLRHATTTVTVSHPIARFTGQISEGTGVIDDVPVLEFYVHVDSALASRFRVRGVVTSADHHGVAEVSTATELPVGASRVKVGVPLKYLGDKAGPFSLANLELVSVDTETTVARLADAYSFSTQTVK